MINKKILIIAPYPIVCPQHGGQKRAAAITEKYKQMFASVKYVAIFHKPSYPEYDKSDIPLGQLSNLDAIDNNPLAMDQIVGKSIDNDAHVRSFFAKMLMDYRPDVIHVEQVFLYEGLSILLRELNMSPKLIYGSQNIEYRMKLKIYDDLGVDPSISTDLVTSTCELEKRFSKSADLVIAVSEEDALAHREMGAKNVVVAANGISKPRTAKVDESVFKEWKIKNNVDTLITFVGSGHPPNYLGVIELIGLDTSFLGINERLVLGGGVSEYFKATYSKRNNKDLWSKMVATGFLSEEQLDDLLRNTDIFALPILSGGGSNLKTAEAILANRKIVSTSYAFRGFEQYLGLPNIYIANDSNEFKRELKNAAHSPLLPRSAKEETLAQTVRWEYSLNPIERGVEKLMTQPHLNDLKRFIYRHLRKLVRRMRLMVGR